MMNDSPGASISHKTWPVAHALWLAPVLHWSLALLLAALPFELYAGVPLGGFTLTNLELLALAAFGLWGALLLAERRLPRTPRALLWPTAVFLALLVLSSIAAPEWRAAALKFSARQAQGVLLALCLADQIGRAGWPLARRLALALVAGAAFSAVLGMIELSESSAVLWTLAIFKEKPTLVGGLLRLSATFGYANIAAMFFEVVLPFALAGAALARPARALWFSVATLLLATSALLTYSRAALLVVLAVALLVGLMALWRARTWGSGTMRSFALHAGAERRVAVSCAGLLAIAAGLLLFSPDYRLRLTAPDINHWFRADYAASPLPSLAPNALARAPIDVSNRGLVTWYSWGLRPVALSYHWLDADTQLVVRYNGLRTPLALPVAPGETVRLDAAVQAPERPGRYILAWDMVAEHVGWFSARGTPAAEVPVIVEGDLVHSQPPPPAEPSNLPRHLSVAPPPPSRSQLWSVAIQFWRSRPLLGIGPDVFRHVYGPALGLSSWDDRIHTNNLYLEVLVGAGAAGFAVFLALVGAALRAGMRTLAHRATTPQGWWGALACTVALVAFLIHGLLDMFLEYTATYLLFWGLIGALHARIPTDSAV